MRRYLLLTLLLIGFLSAFAQKGTIKGRVYNEINNEPLAFAAVGVEGTALGTTTDMNGEYSINDVDPGLYNVSASYLGFDPKTVVEVKVDGNKSVTVNFPLTESSEKLEEVIVKTEAFEKKEEAPVSMRTIGVNEIERNPGGNRDISRVIQTLPGVTPTPAFRNDLIIRGGAPNENRFYLDGIEIPTINHFSTQGAGGGPVGMINVQFIREVEFYSGAFPANRGNTLSSVMEFEQKEGDPDKHNFQGTVGASDFGIAIDGPISDKATYLVSYRRSYLQFLFKQIGLPFLPIYNDLQFKIKYKPSQKDHFTIIGLGAVDNFELNLDANETREQRYILGNLPVNEQWNYTRGLKYTRFHKNSYTNFVASRSKLNNSAFKYENNDDSSPENLILNYTSVETENKVRVENFFRKSGWNLINGVGVENIIYTNNTFNRIATQEGVIERDYNSDLTYIRYGAFTQASKKLLDDRLILSFGARIDGNGYNEEMRNPLPQFSPRFSFSYALNESFSLNFNTGRYFQLPPNTVLGFRNGEGELVNQEGLKYIRCDHLVGGIEWRSKSNSRITLEGFYKMYSDYPFILTDSISLANLGSDFGVVGNDPVESSSKGRSYGAEFLFQQRLFKGFYGIFSYTLLWSEFTDKNSEYTPSAWDSRHIISLTGGKKFKKNWEVGARWWFVTGSPYTPIDIELSTTPEVWNVTGRGLPDYDRLNQARTSNFNQLDVRIDKRYFFKRFNLNWYFDVQNVFGTSQQASPNLDIDRDDNGDPLFQDNGNYQYTLLDNSLGSTLPTIGLIIEF